MALVCGCLFLLWAFAHALCIAGFTCGHMSETVLFLNMGITFLVLGMGVKLLFRYINQRTL